jgi:pilus assembly protein CpaD
MTHQPRNAPARHLHGGATGRRLAPAVLCALLLSACDRLRQAEQDLNATAVGLSNAEVRHPIGFAPRSESLEIEAPPGTEGLSPNQYVDVYRFLHRYQREAAGRLVIAVPSRGHDRAAVAGALRDIQRQVAEAGIDYRVVRGGHHDAPVGGASFIRLSYPRPIAVPPQCGDWSEDLGRNEARIPYPNWGCATQHNLSVMVDNARDLGQPQIEDPRSSERRGVSWSAYTGRVNQTDAATEAAKKIIAPPK